MKKYWQRYRLILLAIILIGVFLFRIIYPYFTKTHRHATQSPLNRNINHLTLTKHARCRMDCRHITEKEINEILHEGTINYDKTDFNDVRGASYALDGYTHEQQHLRIVFAPKKDELVVITCIDFDKEWQCDCN